MHTSFRRFPPPGEIAKELLKIEQIADVEVIDPLFDGFTSGRFFPPKLWGERAIILREPGYRAFARNLRERLGSGYAAILYYIGFEMGANYFSAHKKVAGESFENLVKLSEAMFMQVGFGILKWIKIDTVGGLVIARVWDSFECELFKGGNEPSSHFIRGMLAGWASRLLEKEVSAVEVKCIAMGDPYCEFYIKGSSFKRKYG